MDTNSLKQERTTMEDSRTEVVNKDAELEEALKPLTSAADEAAKQFVASIACLMTEGEKALSEKLTECQAAFANALVRGWRMMLANEISYGFVRADILNQPETEGNNEKEETSN